MTRQRVLSIKYVQVSTDTINLFVVALWPNNTTSFIVMEFKICVDLLLYLKWGPYFKTVINIWKYFMCKFRYNNTTQNHFSFSSKLSKTQNPFKQKIPMKEVEKIEINYTINLFERKKKRAVFIPHDDTYFSSSLFYL